MLAELMGQQHQVSGEAGAGVDGDVDRVSDRTGPQSRTGLGRWGS
jgi:hypothetical protein